MLESSDKMWPKGEGDGNPLQYPCLRKLMDSVKRKKRTLEVEPPGQKVSDMLLGKSGGQSTVTQERMKLLGQSRNGTILNISGGESKVRCCKEQYCLGT